MSEWWTYSLEDFLLFSPRVYWRLFELHNAATWPGHALALSAGVLVLFWACRPRPWSGRAISAVLALSWAWVGWSFLWNSYAAINWAAAYLAPVFGVQALLVAWIGVLGQVRFAASRTVPGIAGLALASYALVLHPLAAPIAGRSWSAAEVFGIAPDPTAILTLGLLSTASGRATGLLLVIPLAWCLLSWATLRTMGAPEAWAPLAAAGIALVSRLWPSGPRRARPRPETEGLSER